VEYGFFDDNAINLLKNCLLCPKECRANRIRGAKGICRTDAGLNIASICVHKGEEPVISGPEGICNIFFSGCNLHCSYCQNYEISRGSVNFCHGEDGETEHIGRESHQNSGLLFTDAIETIESMLKRGIKSVGFVSPSHMVVHVLALISELRSRGNNPITVYNTSGYDKTITIKNFEGLVDVYLPDFKYASPEIADRFSRAYDYPEVALAAIKEMYRQKGSTLITDGSGVAINGLVIRHLVLPDHAEESKKVLRLIAEEISTGVSISLMSQYYPTPQVAEHPSLGKTLTREEYEDVVMEMERLGFRNGWVQEMESSRSYRPDFSMKDPFNR
jgi:putative pyruvate formate lyase activating enzyme